MQDSGPLLKATAAMVLALLAAVPAPAGPAGFSITTASDKAIITMDRQAPGNAIVTVLDPASGTEVGRLNETKNGEYTGYEWATLEPGQSYLVQLSGYLGNGVCGLVLTSLGRSARFTLRAEPAGGGIALSGSILGEPGLVQVGGDRRSLILATP